MIKSKFIRSLILSFCLTVVSTGGVYATTAGSPDTPVSSPAQITPMENKDVLEKQREIDQYVFEQHKDELALKGFTVTHTGPMSDYVEIGIEPYNEANAEHLYEIFGKDGVKIVKGVQAATLGAASTGNGGASEAKATASFVLDEQRGAETEKTSLLLTTSYVLGLVVVLGVIAMAIRRLLSVGK